MLRSDQGYGQEPHEPTPSRAEDLGYCALVLNFCHWRDTRDCVASLFASQVRPWCVVVCDNGSDDDSLERLAEWAQTCGSEGPRSFRLLTRSEAEGNAPTPDVYAEELLLVRNKANLGYGGGNNVGLRLLLRSGTQFIWLLNNDTVVRPAAAGALLAHMRANSRCGLCGALTRYLDYPDVVQCYGGGWYNARWGRGGLHGDGVQLPLGTVPKLNPLALDYVNGASVFLRRDFLQDVGLMEEMYFLYCEELDWATRAKGRWDLCWSPQAEVLHREGLSTGRSNRRGMGGSIRSSAMLVRSRLLFTWKFHPWLLPTVVLGQAFALLRKACRSIGW